MENINIHAGDLKEQLSWDGGIVEELDYELMDIPTDLLDELRLIDIKYKK